MSIQGMFQQLNQTLDNQDPSRGFDESIPGMTPSPLDKVNPLIRNMMRSGAGVLGIGGDYLSSPEKAQISNQQAGQAIQSQDPKALMAAGQLLMSQGRQSEAIQLITMGQQVQAKQNALLEQGQKEIEANVEKAKEEKARSMAKRLATTKGDDVAVKGLESGLITPTDYFTSMRKAMATQKPVTLPDGSMLVNPDGRVIVENKKDFDPKSGSGGSGASDGPNLSSAEKKKIIEYNDNSRSHLSNASRMETLALQFSRFPEKEERGGLPKTIAETFKEVTGSRDALSMATTFFFELRNTIAMGNLPPGTASDADVALAMQGVPPNNATNAEVAEWLGAVARIEAALGNYYSFGSNHISRHGAAFIDREWNKKQTPPAALKALKGSPSEENKRAFASKYRWLPEDME